MSHARIEEVSDSDLESASDPSEGDIDDFDDADILRRVDPKHGTPAQTNVPTPQTARPSAPAAGQAPDANFHTTADASQYADYHCLYPVYFDAARTRAEGRRVSAARAVRNPLAREIVNACAALRIPTLFEPGKSHPKDWANPGRVKVRLPRDDPAVTPTRPVDGKHHLYLLVADHLRAHPAAEDSLTLRARIQGVPPAIDPAQPWPRPAVPRGWKMGELLPYISPAMTGGGVSENLFGDMMKEMQHGGGPAADNPMAALMAQGMPGAGGNAIEDKPGKKKKGKGKA
ncbi:Signal recognition particle SEC65 subunit like protein [Verticillium longisporum]|nr:Signal recognition particle SEC65 subunit like protein [Verticillium longisporum]